MDLKKKSAISLALSLFSGFITLLNSLVIARTLSLEEYGVFSLASTIIFLFIQFSSMGLNDIIYKKIPLLKEKHSFIKSIVFLNSSIGLVTSLILLIFSKNIASIYSSVLLEPLLVLGSGFVFIGSLFNLLSIIFACLKRFEISIVMRFLDGLFKLLLNIFVILFFGLTAYLSLLTAIMSELIICAVIFILAFKFYNKYPLEKRDFYVNLIVEALPFALIPILSYLVSYLNDFLVGYIVGVVDVGIYSIAKFSTKVFSFISPVFSSILIPLFVESKDEDKIIQKGLNYFYLIAVPLSIIFIFRSADIILIIFGRKYLVADFLFKIVSASVIQGGIVQIFFSYYFAKRSPKRILLYNIILISVQLLISITLILLFGSIGAVITDVVVTTFAMFLLFCFIKKSFHLLKLFKIIIICLIPSFVLLLNIFNKAMFNLPFVCIIYSILVCIIYFLTEEINDFIPKQWLVKLRKV